MPKDPIAYGKQFLKNTLGYSDEQISQIPEDKIRAAGEGVLRQEDYSAAMNAHKQAYDATEQWKRDLANWKAGVDRDLAEGKAAKERLADLEKGGGAGNLKVDDAGGGSASRPPDLSGFTKKDELSTEIQKVHGQAVAYATDVSIVVGALVANHQAEFGKPLDTRALLQFCRERGLKFEDGYDQFVKPVRDEREKQVRADEIKAAEERGRKLALSEMSSALPFPTGPGSIDGEGNHTLDGIADGKTYDRTTAVDRASQTFREEVAKRHAS